MVSVSESEPEHSQQQHTASSSVEPLSDAPVGVALRVMSVAADPANHRLLEMGLVPGTPLEVARRAPLGGPLLLRFRGGVVAVDRTWASVVGVQRQPAGAGATI